MFFFFLHFNPIPALRNTCVCVLHFHCCQNTRPDLCGIWGSGPAHMDPDLRLKTRAQEKIGFSFKRRTLALETTMCRLLTPLPIKPNISPAHKALAALIPSFILFQMFSNVLLTFGGDHNYTWCCTVFIYYAVGHFSVVYMTA